MWHAIQGSSKVSFKSLHIISSNVLLVISVDSCALFCRVKPCCERFCKSWLFLLNLNWQDKEPEVIGGHVQASVRSCCAPLFVCGSGGTLGDDAGELLLSHTGVVHWGREFLWRCWNICRILFTPLRSATLYLLRDTNKITVKQQPHISSLIQRHCEILGLTIEFFINRLLLPPCFFNSFV